MSHDNFRLITDGAPRLDVVSKYVVSKCNVSKYVVSKYVVSKVAHGIAEKSSPRNRQQTLFYGLMDKKEKISVFLETGENLRLEIE